MAHNVIVAGVVMIPFSKPGVRVGLQHSLGLGGACVVTLYRAS